MNRALREFSETVITAAVIFVLLQATTQTFRVVGPSMKQTLSDGQHLLVNRTVYANFESDFLAELFPWVDESQDTRNRYMFHGPEAGDVIVFQPPGGATADFVKRVIGVPGDTIDIRDGKVFVNGEERKGDPRTLRRGTLDYPVTVPPDQYFVLGDNRSESNDSRVWGYVHADDIIGRVFIRYWPLSDLKLF